MTDEVWIHGNAAQIEVPNNLTNASPTQAGFVVTAAGESAGRIHLPFPTPTVKDGIRARVTAIHFVAADVFGFVSGFELYDGTTLVASFPTPQDKPSFKFDLTLTLPSPHPVKEALNFAVFYQWNGELDKYGKPIAADSSSLTIYAAGAEYDYPPPLGDATPIKNPPSGAGAQIQPKK
jgi:hypothetical protein